MSGGLPRHHPVLQEWYEKVRIMMDELLIWLGKKNKHYHTGFPLAAKLMCISLQQADYEVGRFQSFVERLHKLMRDTIFSEAVRKQFIYVYCSVDQTICLGQNPTSMHSFRCCSRGFFRNNLDSVFAVKSIDWLGMLGSVHPQLCTAPWCNWRF